MEKGGVQLRETATHRKFTVGSQDLLQKKKKKNVTEQRPNDSSTHVFFKLFFLSTIFKD